MNKKIITAILLSIVLLSTSCSHKESNPLTEEVKNLKQQIKEKDKKIEELNNSNKKITEELEALKTQLNEIKQVEEEKENKNVPAYKHNQPLSTPGMNNINGYIEASTIKDPYILQEVTKESLINKYNRLPDGYEPDDLVEIKSNTWDVVQLRKEAAEAFEKLRQDAEKEGIEYVVFSAYRPYSLQKTLYDNEYELDSLSAIQGTAYPGCSEHSSGFAMDISYNENFPEDFYSTEHGKFLEENAHKYGFILRYPKDKEDITNYMYESWHYRYVGVEMAKEIKERNITLEEYYGTDKYEN